EGAVRQIDLYQLADEARGIAFGYLPGNETAGGVLAGLAERDGAYTLEGSLDRAGDRARIGHVVGHIGADVDAGKHEVRLLVENLAHAHDDAIRRRAAQREMAIRNLAQAQRLRER